MSETKPGMDSALVRAESSSIAVVDGVCIPRTMDEQLKFCKWALSSKLLPSSIETVQQAWVVLQRGSELGFKGLAAFSFLYVVGGKPNITPDGVKALALNSGMLIDAKEEILGSGDHMMAQVTVVRRGLPTPIVAQFSVQDAKIAGLWGKTGTRGASAWVTYPQRMLLARARGWAYGDAFKDLVGGMRVREQFDLEPGEALGEATVTRRAAMPPPPPGPDPLLAELSGEPDVDPTPTIEAPAITYPIADERAVPPDEPEPPVVEEGREKVRAMRAAKPERRSKPEPVFDEWI